MEQALCMAHWLKHCKVNEPIYILSAAIWAKWQDRCFLHCAVALCCSTQRNVSGPPRSLSTINIKLMVKKKRKKKIMNEIRCGWKKPCRKHRRGCTSSMGLIWLNPLTDDCIKDPCLLMDAKCVLYQIWLPRCATSLSYCSSQVWIIAWPLPIKTKKKR